MTKKAITIASLPAALALADLTKAIDGVIKQASTLQDKVQQVGLQCLMHLEKHGDIGPINRLIVGLPKGLRRQALASWAMAYGALSVNVGQDKATKPFNYDKTKKTDPAAAVQDPWFNHKPEPEISDVFDLQKAVQAILARAKDKKLCMGKKQMDAKAAEDAIKALKVFAGEGA